MVNVPILAGIIGYNVIVILIISIWLKMRARTHNVEEDFILSGRNLPFYVVAATQALTCLGGGHVMGLTGQGQVTGIVTQFYAFAHGGLFFLSLYYYGPWMRRMGFTTINQAFATLWSPAVRPLCCGGAVALMFAVLTLETQGLGAIFAITCGIQVWQGCIIGAAIGFLYVIIAGMKEVGWVNLINAIVMYVICIIAAVMFNNKFEGGWGMVNEFYINKGMGHILTVFGNAEIVKTYLIGTVVSCLFGLAMAQSTVQSAIAVKDVRTCKKAAILAIPLNVMFATFMISFGMGAEAAGYGQGGGVPVFAMAMDLLPTWMAFMLLGVFLAAILSTFAMMLLSISTIFVQDIQKPYFCKTPMTVKQENKVTRIWIVILTVLGCYVSAYLPTVANAIIWAFSWMVPLALIFVIGMHFRRSTPGFFITIIVAWVANIVCSLTPIGTQMGNNYSIVMAVIAIVLGLITAAVDPKAKPAFIKVYKAQRAEWDAKHKAVSE